MNDEIKEDVTDLMELLETTSKKEFYRLTIDHELVVRLYNYIINLQQENERLKVNCNLGYEELKVARNYKSRCEKALEYLDKIETLAMSDGKIIFSINTFRNILQNEKK